MADSSPGKPEAEKLGWKLTGSRVPFSSKLFTVREDRLTVPGRDEPLAYAYAERPGGVIIIPVTPAGEIVLVRQYRLPVDAWCLETPAGSTGDTAGMPLEEVVRKELKEEIGATAERVEQIGQFFSAPSYATEVCFVFIAWGVRLAQPPEPEPTEKMKIEIVAAAEALRLAENGGIQNAACALAVCYARPALQAAGFV